MEGPAGWYPDPDRGGAQRWWNGQAWTDHVPSGAQATAATATRTNWRRVLPMLAAFAGLLLIAAVVFVPKLIRTFTGSINGANIYLRDIRDGHNAEAYARLCSELRSQGDLEGYIANLRSERSQSGGLVSFNANHTSVEAGSPDAIVTIHVRTTQSVGDIEARLRKEQGQWRWCGSRPAPKSTTIRVPLF